MRRSLVSLQPDILWLVSGETYLYLKGNNSEGVNMVGKGKVGRGTGERGGKENFDQDKEQTNNSNKNLV